MSGLLLAAPQSGSGKTTITLGLLRALKKSGQPLAPGKAGPDYIDPAFHAAASGETCLNFDAYAMRPELLLANASLHKSGGRLMVVEAMMGLYDGAANGEGSAADLACLLGLSVVLVVDCARMSQSIAALVKGFMDFRADLLVVGVILNRVASPRHEAMLRQALDAIGVKIFGAIPADPGLVLPERHLGLVQAGEHKDLAAFIEHASGVVEKHCDLSALLAAAHFVPDRESHANIARLPPLGSHIAIARDEAFAFCYEHMLLGWKRRGAALSFFSPLADQAPDPAADAIYLPGGYPELHAEKLAAAQNFKRAMLEAAAKGTRIYGECGGYMVLGQGLVAANGVRHSMLGLLPLVTSFERRKRSLGYRRLKPLPNPFFGEALVAHEFHYSTILEEGQAARLFTARDALGQDLGAVGMVAGAVAGSYMHILDLAS